jgi:ligand-binding sensor domain-containing protein
MRAIERSLLAVAVVVMALGTVTTGAGAQARWTTHVSPSWVREIVHRDGILYLATGGGLLVYNIAGDRFTHFTNVSGLPSNDLTCLDIRSDGTLYVGMGDIGMARVAVSGDNLSILRRFNQRIDGLADNAVNSVAVWNDDLVYGTEGGAGTVVSDFPAAVYRVIEGMPSNRVLDVLPVGNVAWMATDSGTVALDDLGLLRIPSGGPAAANVIGTDGTLIYVGTDDGVWSLDPSDSTWAQIGPVATTPRIYSLHYDGQTLRAGDYRNLWTYTGGTSWTATSLASVYTSYDLSASSAQIKGLAVADNGDVYLGTGSTSVSRGLNLIRYDGSTVTNYAPSAPNASWINRLSVDVDGSVWAAFWRLGVGKLDRSGQWMEYNATVPAGDSLSSRFNTVCLADPDGYKWFHTIGFDLDRLDDGVDGDYSNDGWLHLGLFDGGGSGLGSVRLQNAVVDPAGNRWFLSDADDPAVGEGIQILSRDQSEWLSITTATANAALASGDVTDVAFTTSVAYVALDEWGVQGFRPGGYTWSALTDMSAGEWFSFWPKDPDVGKVNTVARTDDGKVWIGTNNGLYRIDTRLLPTDDRYERRFGQFAGFGTGLLSIAINDLLVDHEGDLWVATTAGLNRISAQDENDIDAWSTQAEYQNTLSDAQYSFDVISPLVDANCLALALAPDQPVLYIATLNGLSVFRYPEPPPAPIALSKSYLYPNPVYGRMGQTEVKVEDITEPVVVEIYNVEGELVHSTPSGETLSAGEAVWDLTDQGGFLVASGVYFVRIISTTTGNAVVKPISIVR